MVVQLRVDARLIHGQFVLAWGKELNTPRIIVVDDEAAVNKTIAATLNMAAQAAGPQFKLIIKSYEDAIALINDERIVDNRIICVTRTTETAARLALECGKHVDTLNCGHGSHKDESSVKLIGEGHLAMRLNDTEIELLKQVIAKGEVEVVHWHMPYTKKENVKELFEANGLM